MTFLNALATHWPKNTYSNISIVRAQLLLIFTFLFNLQSTHAQTYRGYGSDGEPEKPLPLGWKVPDDFWTRKHLFYINGDTIRKSLKEYEGKPLILDFWGTSCRACIEGFPKLMALKKKYGDTVNFLLINSIKKDDFTRIHQMKDETLRNGYLKTIYNDRYFAQMFPYKAIPQYLWINARGVLEAVTMGKYVNETQLEIIANYK